MIQPLKRSTPELLHLVREGLGNNTSAIDIAFDALKELERREAARSSLLDVVEETLLDQPSHMHFGPALAAIEKLRR